MVPGEFDFVYLRFDWVNRCNVSITTAKVRVSCQVGYAFVNFTSVPALGAFLEARVGTKWDIYPSDKVVQVSSGQNHASMLTFLRYVMRWYSERMVAETNLTSRGKQALVNKFRFAVK